MTSKLGATLHAGGGNKRRADLEAEDVVPSHITGYFNRWGSTFAVAKTLTQNEDLRGETDARAIAVVQRHVAAWVPAAGDADDDGTSRLAQVKQAFSEEHIYGNMLQLGLALSMGEHVDTLITAAGGDEWTPTRPLTAHLAALKERLTRFKGASDGDLDMTIDHIKEQSPLEFNEVEVGAMRARLRGYVKAAATAALNLFTKHLDPAMEVMQLRFMYCPAHEPPPLPALPAVAAERKLALSKFLGFDERTDPFSAKGEYETYRSSWSGLSVSERAMKPALFWVSKKEVYPALSRLGMWWSEVPSSSVAVERMFAVMRAIARPNRASMKEPAFEAEWLFRVNADLVNKRLEQALAAVDRMG